EVDLSVESGCIWGEDGMMSGIKGERRVKNVMVGDEPIDPGKIYTVAGQNYSMLKHGDGQTAFDGATVLQEEMRLDNQMLIDYVSGTLGGVIGADYDDPTGQGRITILE
ncbi:MAG: 5'-nucleotidase C-terminal domain-containing protein, partial [Lachnospiraceae bacterium]|nr:5'-nucleotidase C-terminal domain-containing protein [Lachnospiraceae bacterium]